MKFMQLKYVILCISEIINKMSLQKLNKKSYAIIEKRVLLKEFKILQILMVATLALFLLLIIIDNVNAMEYTGDLELCVLDTLGDEICLNNGDSYDINNSRTYYMILQPKNEIRDIGDAIDIFYKLFTSAFLALILILALSLILGKIMLMRK